METAILRPQAPTLVCARRTGSLQTWEDPRRSRSSSIGIVTGYSTQLQVCRRMRMPSAFAVAPDLSPVGLSYWEDSDRFGTPPVSSPLWGFVGGFEATAPDFEFKIPNVSTLPGFDAASGFAFTSFRRQFSRRWDGSRFPPRVVLPMSICQLPLQTQRRLRSLR